MSCVAGQKVLAFPNQSLDKHRVCPIVADAAEFLACLLSGVFFFHHFFLLSFFPPPPQKNTLVTWQLCSWGRQAALSLAREAGTGWVDHRDLCFLPPTVQRPVEGTRLQPKGYSHFSSCPSSCLGLFSSSESLCNHVSPKG